MLLFSSFNATPTTHIYTLSLDDALPISPLRRGARRDLGPAAGPGRHGHDRPQGGSPRGLAGARVARRPRSEEHTSELQSLRHLVCRLLLEKKKLNYRYRELVHGKSVRKQ